MKKHAPPVNLLHARDMRSNPTDAEAAMWRLLREAFPAARFRRQVPLRHFIVDFASHRLRLVIEIDGGQHNAKVDARRSLAIEAEGYRILRFWNSEVLDESEACWHKLDQVMRHHHPHPATTRQQAAKSSHPSPIKGEEK